jgi:hypothetical protein
VGIAALLGVFGLCAVSSIYWNWYGFPNAFFLAQAVDMMVGWSLAGAMIARLISYRLDLTSPWRPRTNGIDRLTRETHGDTQ